MDYRYLIFYKPYDVLSQFTDTRTDTRIQAKRTTLKAFIPIPGVYPVGRLDRDSEGLLLLTDDGPLQQRLCHPRFGHPRTYWVQVEGIPDAQSLERLRQGVTIRNYTTRPAQVELLCQAPALPPRIPPIRVRKHIPTAWLQLTLQEGKNRQVRRMTAAVGFPTLRLVRARLGSLQVEHLQPGQWRYLTPDERGQLRQLTKGCDRPNTADNKHFHSSPKRRYR
ncbi:MAG: pseudouridine synthase [Cyanobacteria bacterium P01_D01_bin.2]